MGGTSLTWRRGNKSNGIGIHADTAPMGVLDVLNDAWTATNALRNIRTRPKDSRAQYSPDRHEIEPTEGLGGG